MLTSPAELLKGTLDLVILRSLELQPMHGSAVPDRVAQIIAGAFQVKAGCGRIVHGMARVLESA